MEVGIYIKCHTLPVFLKPVVWFIHLWFIDLAKNNCFIHYRNAKSGVIIISKQFDCR
jgi:hypothetical protein